MSNYKFQRYAQAQPNAQAQLNVQAQPNVQSQLNVQSQPFFPIDRNPNNFSSRKQNDYIGTQSVELLSRKIAPPPGFSKRKLYNSNPVVLNAPENKMSTLEKLWTVADKDIDVQPVVIPNQELIMKVDKLEFLLRSVNTTVLEMKADIIENRNQMNHLQKQLTQESSAVKTDMTAIDTKMKSIHTGLKQRCSRIDDRIVNQQKQYAVELAAQHEQHKMEIALKDQKIKSQKEQNRLNLKLNDQQSKSQLNTQIIQLNAALEKISIRFDCLSQVTGTRIQQIKTIQLSVQDQQKKLNQYDSKLHAITSLINFDNYDLPANLGLNPKKQ
jgi:hypothetical protein